VVTRAWQEHGLVVLDAAAAGTDLPVGTKLRVAPNHVCMTVAAHDRYFVVDGSAEVVAVWPRVNGW
jgi:D-serine deaminase-like pyridoxal phosphate-dependent protein